MRKIIVKCLAGFFIISASPSAPAAQTTIGSIPDTSGSMGTATITTQAVGPYAKGYKNASSFVTIDSSGAKWQSECGGSNGIWCASAGVIRETENLEADISSLPLKLPTIELIPLYFEYRDGTPASNSEIVGGGDNLVCKVDDTSRCNWNANIYSPIVKMAANQREQRYFTDNEGKFFLVLVKERVRGEWSGGGISVNLIRDGVRYNAGKGTGQTGNYNFAEAQPNNRIRFDIDSPSAKDAKRASAEAQLNANKCVASKSGEPISQIPTCSGFAPLPSGQSILVANDPLTYQEQTPNSVIALQGLSENEVTSVASLTSEFCNSPSVLSGFNWVDKSKMYLSVTTGSEGMCRLKVTTTLGAVFEVQMPVSSWSVSTMRPPTISGNNLSNRGILPVGKSIQLSNLSFNYSGSTFKVGQVAPLYFDVKNENTCSVDANFLVLAKSSGECVIIIGWPEFAFGSRVYSSSSNEYVLFTVKSSAELAQDAEKIKQDAEKAKSERLALAEKAKQNAKLCKPSDQSRLRNSYAPLMASNKRSSELRSKLSRVDYLIGQVGKNGPIQLPPSEYADLLAGYPVLANSRQVPVFVYQAILQGSIIGEKKNYQSAFAIANLAYSKASAGCKKVIGKP
jgi:hypothetical protein